MRKLKPILLALFLLLPNWTYANTFKFTKIILKRTEEHCSHSGSNYQIEINFNGDVIYRGRNNVKILGKRTAKLSKNQLHKLEQILSEINWRSLSKQYVVDNDGCDPETEIIGETWATVTILTSQYKKRITHYLGCGGASSQLQQIEEQIDKIVNAKQWVGDYKEQKTSPALLKSLEKALQK